MPFPDRHRFYATAPLQQKLLLTFLPVVLLPLTIAGVWGSIVTHQRIMQQAELRLKNQSKLTAIITHKELERKTSLLNAISIDPMLLKAAKEGNEQAQKANLPSLSIVQAETKFAQTKRLRPDAFLEEHLQNLSSIGNFAELFFTDSNGFNITYTNATSDFVQRDELWWQQGKQYRQWIGSPEFDESTQKVTIQIVQAINDPETKQFLGVIKAGYNAAYLDHLIGELQNLQLIDTEEVQILSLDQKLISIATLTPSGVNNRQTLMEGDSVLQKARERLETHHSSEQKRDGSQTRSEPLTEEFGIVTEAIVAADRWYAITKIPGTSWVAIASIDLDQARAGSYQLITIFALIFLSLGIAATGVIVRVSRRLSAPLNQLSQMAQQVTEQADFTVQIPVSGEDQETRVLADSFNQLIQRVQQLLTEQIEIQHQLEHYNQTLEEKVGTRTQELNEKTKHLQEALEELQRTQAQMIQSAKMSSLGQLVAGIAHEINNPVNFIHGNLRHMRSNTQNLLDLIALYETECQTAAIAHKIEDMDLEFLRDDIPKLLNSMTLGTERIREIVKSLRTFSRLDEAEVKAIDLHESLDSTLMILQNRFRAKPDRSKIQVIKTYAELPEVDCCAGELNQVLMNILTNAIDAIEERLITHPAHQPHIKISTKQPDRDRVEIAIADNGVGIPESIQPRIFDPFFTTKEVGKGTGMGLSISYQIITEKHGGELECVSAPGQGTLFLIRIPVHQQILEPAQVTKFS
ncbi:HAMP domain-containing protein [Cyanobacteria bacterium FACHB-63]|nr:HAMP domain-containing protein [Cyanobacteria bacterium FACHB-63]